MSNESKRMWSSRFRKVCSAAIICAGLIFGSTYALGQTGCSSDVNAQAFTVGAGSFIQLPLGRFLLVRKDGHIGAIRITSISPDTTVQTKGSEWIGRIDYESYLLRNQQQSTRTRYCNETHRVFGIPAHEGVWFPLQLAAGKQQGIDWFMAVWVFSSRHDVHGEIHGRLRI
jgi:hypothetical protein